MREQPGLIQRRQIKGDLHCHTTYSDGTDPLADMALAAIAMEYEYLAVTDHAKTTHVKSLSESMLKIQREEIEDLNAEFAGRLTILQGTELDIGPDGSLPELEGGGAVDLTVASLHSHFDLDRAHMTDRVVKALSHPSVRVFGHPTARRQGIRPPVQMDLEAVFRTAAENRVALEINSAPTRLDLRDDHIRLARKYGCIFSIDTDSHAASSLPRVTLGLELAQKAGLGSEEVINCLPLDALKNFLSRA